MTVILALALLPFAHWSNFLFELVNEVVILESQLLWLNRCKDCNFSFSRLKIRLGKILRDEDKVMKFVQRLFLSRLTFVTLSITADTRYYEIHFLWRLINFLNSSIILVNLSFHKWEKQLQKTINSYEKTI